MKLAAVPPSLLRFPEGKAFHLSLTEKQLLSPVLRLEIGNLSNHIANEKKEEVDRSIQSILSMLNEENELAAKHLTEFRAAHLLGGRKSRTLRTFKRQEHSRKSKHSSTLEDNLRRTYERVPNAAMGKTPSNAAVRKNSGASRKRQTKSKPMV